MKKQENSDLPEQHERTTQESGNLGEKTKESGDQEGLKISSPDSKHKEQVPVGVEERGKSEITSIPIQVRSLVTSNTGSRDQRWEHYISRSELQEKLEPFFGDDEDSHSDLFVAEFIKWQKEKGGLALCQKLIRDALGNVKKIEAEKCSNLSI
ncbi:hypothetical protein MSUIS_01230 [Mycoplasma suis KI3806]|uniref:Uncharacterized protein n=1 Tax=Mycoplasma suis (strain KI_3806) TaxID=708248 RepID=F0V2Z4_MYCS3|nr:hypothetical protein [Mycoplasma suis]CBZ40216.1 hypothetical protein MSUIS_01230 [Mycoplasma suis KI3806]